jgi:hypothetical protein
MSVSYTNIEGNVYVVFPEAVLAKPLSIKDATPDEVVQKL